jgi:hypothetical protein
MRLGVLDVGSNTVHLLVVDAHPGSHPDPVRSHKNELRLAELIGPDGSLGPHGRDLLIKAVADAADAAREEEVEDLVAFATSAVREAVDGGEAIEAVRDATGVDLVVLSGEDEAAMTFLAVRRWFGWSSGRLLCLDIGGGSLEIASGRDELPDLAVSVPLGAGRLTRERLPGDPPARRDVIALREHVWQVLAEVVPAVHDVGPFDRLRLKAFRSHGLGCPTALLGRPAVPLLGLVRQAKQDGHPQVHPHISSVLTHPEHVATSLAITSWTVNRPQDLTSARDLGLHAVITDDPCSARQVLVPGLARVS